MAVAPLTKIGIMSLKEKESDIMEALYDFGGIQIIDKGQSAEFKNDLLDRLSEFEYKLAQTKFALNFIDRHRPEEKISFREKMVKMANQGININKQKIDKLLEEFDYLKTVKQVEELESQLNSVNLKINQLQTEIEDLKPWSSLVNVYHSESAERIQTKLGLIPKDQFAELQQDKNYTSLGADIAKVFETDSEYGLTVVYLAEAVKSVSELLNQYLFKEVILPDYTDRPEKVIVKRQQELEELVAEKTKLSKTAAEAVSYEKKLKIVHDYLSWQRDKMAARVQADDSAAVFYLKGWLEKARLPELQKRLAKFTELSHVEEIAIADDEEIPVALRNKSYIRPFESVTNIYGAPKVTELDPTPYLAPFFILFFGICLSDAGYGLLLALFSFLIIKFMKVPRSKQGMLRLLIYAGIVTFIVGVLFGGYFGIIIDDLPNGAIKSLLLQMRIIDPVKNPLTMLIFALMLGGMQIIAGIIVNIYYQITRRNWSKAFDGGAWLFLMFGIVFWLVANQVLDSNILVTIGKYWMYAGLAILVLTQGRKNKNIFLKLPLGALSLYDLVGYFSDIMSYSRLLALGLSTGIIAMVVNIVAFLFKDMIPFIGWPVAIVILIGGHLFNLAINALGSFIHSGRLQYVEFFPKFMEGGGVRFKPLEKQAKYIDIYNNDN